MYGWNRWHMSDDKDKKKKKKEIYMNDLTKVHIKEI